MTDAVAAVETELRPLARAGPGAFAQPWLWAQARRLVAVVVSAAVAATLGLLVADVVTQHARADRAQASLRSTEHLASTVAADLATLRHDLGDVTTQVGRDTTTLDQDAAQLKGAQTSLQAAESNVNQQGWQIIAVHTCVNGVQEALNALAVGNQSAALWMLTLVQSSCSAATSSGG